MSASFRYRYFDWWLSRRGAIALLIVLTTGLLVGYYGRLALFQPPTQTYRLHFEGAKWIQSSQPGDNVCFRKDIYLADTPKHAWLQMSGINSFRLFVNGKNAGITTRVAESDPTIAGLFVGGHQSVICDITEYLVAGTNTIGVNATRGTYPGRSKIICEGAVVLPGGTTRFVSDTSWRVSLVPGTVPSLGSWVDPAMDDSGWPHAVEAEAERPSFNQPVPLPPVLVQKAIQGKWLIDSHPAPGGTTSFERRFDAIAGNRDTWLQVASTGAFSIVLNGHFLGSFDDSVPTVKLLNIQRWLRPTDNQLLLKVQSPATTPAIIAEVSFLAHGAEAGSVVSDYDWQLPNGRSATAVARYNYSGDRWGTPAKMSVPTRLSDVEAMRAQVAGISFMVVIALTILLFWLLLARLLSNSQADAERFLAIDATLHLPALVATTTLLLLCNDIRFRPDAPISVGWFIVILLLLFLPRLLIPLWRQRSESVMPASTLRDEWQVWAQRYGFYVVLGLIVLGALIIRLHNLTAFPLDQDDILIRDYAQGVLDRGYASLDFYGYIIPTTTYELLPYPVALSCLLFGWNDWAVLLPAVIFGTLTVLFIGLMGRSLFDWRVGLAAALIEAFNPINVFWSQHCFHPSQDQFFAVITLWTFYLAIREPGRLHVKYFYCACFSFLFLYFSWEGVGLLLPALAGALMLLHPGRWAWLREPHLWVGLIIVGALVLVQLSLRKMAAPGYLFLGSGLAQLGGPQAYFLNPESMPFYYVSNFLLTAPLLPLTILTAFGVLFAWQNKPLRYGLSIFGALLFAFSLTLPVYSIRYFYFYEFLLPLLGCAVFFILWDRIRELIAGWWPARSVVAVSAVVVLLLVFGVATQTGVEALRLSNRPEPSLRYGVVRQDTRGPAEYVASHLRAGDIVLANLTQAFYLYGNRMPDYSLDTLLASRMIYLNDSGAYRHRFVGVPMIRNLRDAANVFGQGRRVWYIGGGPITVGRSELRDALDYITQRSKVVFSTYHSKVYLWDGTVTLAQTTVVNPAMPPQPEIAPLKPAPVDALEETNDGSSPDQPVSNPDVTQSALYPEWTGQKVLERDPARSNAEPSVPPLQPARKPERPTSDENPKP